jgi:Resolvase, N terminal domain
MATACLIELHRVAWKGAEPRPDTAVEDLSRNVRRGDIHDDRQTERRMTHSRGHTSQRDHPFRYAVNYTRVSTEDQGKGCSMPTPIDACQKRAERDGYTVPDAHVLVDEGLSGPTREHPGGERARPS